MIEEAQIGTAQMLYYSNNEQTPQMIIFEKIPHTLLLLLLSFDNIYSVSPKVDLEVSNHSSSSNASVFYSSWKSLRVRVLLLLSGLLPENDFRCKFLQGVHFKLK